MTDAPRPPRSDRNRSGARPGGKPRGKPHGKPAAASNPAPARPAAVAPADRPHADRAEALRLIGGVLEQGRSLAELAAGAPALAPAQRARAGRLAAETLRRAGQAEAVLKRFLRRAPPPAARHALMLAAVEVLALGVAPHAAAGGAVEALRAQPGGERLTGVVNAVARKLAEQGPSPWAAQDAARANMPGWMWGRLSSAWGAGAARRIAEAHLLAPPIDLTPKDPARAADLAEALGADLLPTGSLRLRERGQITALPGYEAGDWWVQDAAAALPARLLGDVTGLRALDLCAAPGGKTLQLAAAGAHVTALDIAATRLERVSENLARTGLTAEIVQADALDWEPDAPFDVILLDAPCSATGTARRHPDMPHLRASLDLPGLTALQDAMLDRAAGWLKPGGRMVFATCSLLPEEGEMRAEAFATRGALATVPADPQALGIPPDWVSERGFLRTRPDFWPDSGGLDGFFAAIFRKET